MTQNRLIGETSPYLLQHARNPVNWWPWCEEAFAKARREDKPVFLSIGYSTCHWCHVMERESFEDADIAALLNGGFVSVKVDKEERPDIDSVYMEVCQAFTGGGGWPLTILMTPERQPFFAGTYIPKEARYHSVGLVSLLVRIREMWRHDRQELLQAGDKVIRDLEKSRHRASADPEALIETGVDTFKHSFDRQFGGFGPPPKFPSPHNLLFLLRQYEITRDSAVLHMAEHTLRHMYRGGLFDHVGFGFSRYSTDRLWLVPHFEKMLYDNALLTMAYLEAFRLTRNELYKTVAVRTMTYVARELTDERGGFFCAQDADSEGVEGKYYVFTPEEIIGVLGPEDGARFNERFDITAKGNFEGKSIPNLLESDETDDHADKWLSAVYEYRRGRTTLHLDDKILASWNALMLAAYAKAYKVLGEEQYLRIAQRADAFLMEHLSDGDRMFTSYRAGRRSSVGFLDDHAYTVFALLELYEASYDRVYLDRAARICEHTTTEFYDGEGRGFTLYGATSEQLILKPRETYDGAMPSGNSVMAYNLVKLARLTKNSLWEELARRQMDFLSAHAAVYPAGHSFFLMAAQTVLYHTQSIVCALKDAGEKEQIIRTLPPHAHVVFVDDKDITYPLLNDQTTFYLCDGDRCHPPVNTLDTNLR